MHEKIPVAKNSCIIFNKLIATDTIISFLLYNSFFLGKMAHSQNNRIATKSEVKVADGQKGGDNKIELEKLEG